MIYTDIKEIYGPMSLQKNPDFNSRDYSNVSLCDYFIFEKVSLHKYEIKTSQLERWRETTRPGFKIKIVYSNIHQLSFNLRAYNAQNRFTPLIKKNHKKSGYGIKLYRTWLSGSFDVTDEVKRTGIKCSERIPFFEKISYIQFEAVCYFIPTAKHTKIFDELERW